jgi:hypothetical protein
VLAPHFDHRAARGSPAGRFSAVPQRRDPQQHRDQDGPNGGSGNDILVGGSNKDTLNGGSDFDTADGRGGFDTCGGDEKRTSCEVTS